MFWREIDEIRAESHVAASGGGPMTSPLLLIDRIAALPDEQAIIALALVLERQGRAIDLYTQLTQQERLCQALSQPEITDHIQPDPSATDGDLARTALAHFADSEPTTVPLVEDAISLAPMTQRDPVKTLRLTLSVGALVLMAFDADIDVRPQRIGGWTLEFRSKSVTDANIGKLLSQLLGYCSRHSTSG
jgi:hypothetical protein